MRGQSGWIYSIIVFLLGVRHGLDWDHLATIDAMARAVRHKKYLSQSVGFLFSLGHGIVVTLLSVIIGAGLVRTAFPAWLDSLGDGVSLFFLLLFSGYNLWRLLRKPAATSVELQGPKTIFLKKWMKNSACSPLFILCVGALFAISFDTFTQVSLFSISAKAPTWGGILGVIFMFGMMVSDSCNGLLTAACLRYADKKSALISRIVGYAVILFSFCMAISKFSLLVA